MLVLFEGGEGAVHAQATELGGEDTEPWPEVRALQADLHRQVRWDGGDAPLVRPGPRVAYVEGEPSETWSPLAERVVAALREASCSRS